MRISRRTWTGLALAAVALSGLVVVAQTVRMPGPVGPGPVVRVAPTPSLGGTTLGGSSLSGGLSAPGLSGTLHVGSTPSGATSPVDGGDSVDAAVRPASPEVLAALDRLVRARLNGVTYRKRR